VAFLDEIMEELPTGVDYNVLIKLTLLFFESEGMMAGAKAFCTRFAKNGGGVGVIQKIINVKNKKDRLIIPEKFIPVLEWLLT